MGFNFAHDLTEKIPANRGLGVEILYNKKHYLTGAKFPRKVLGKVVQGTQDSYEEGKWYGLLEVPEVMLIPLDDNVAIPHCDFMPEEGKIWLIEVTKDGSNLFETKESCLSELTKEFDRLFTKDWTLEMVN